MSKIAAKDRCRNQPHKIPCDSSRTIEREGERKLSLFPPPTALSSPFTTRELTAVYLVFSGADTCPGWCKCGSVVQTCRRKDGNANGGYICGSWLYIRLATKFDLNFLMGMQAKVSERMHSANSNSKPQENHKMGGTSQWVTHVSVDAAHLQVIKQGSFGCVACVHLSSL